jgi:Transketolase, thiamine diphosphate binding domain
LQAIANAKAVTDKPSLIKVSTLIGYGSPNKADTHDVHGAPLGPDETAATRANLKWPYGEFEVPQEVYDVMRSSVTRGSAAEEEWKASMAAYKAKYPKEAEELETLLKCVCLCVALNTYGACLNLDCTSTSTHELLRPLHPPLHPQHSRLPAALTTTWPFTFALLLHTWYPATVFV